MSISVRCAKKTQSNTVLWCYVIFCCCFVLFSTTIGQYFSSIRTCFDLLCYLFFFSVVYVFVCKFYIYVFLCIVQYLCELCSYARRPGIKTNTNGKQHINCTHSNTHTLHTLNTFARFMRMCFLIHPLDLFALNHFLSLFVSEINLLCVERVRTHTPSSPRN